MRLTYRQMPEKNSGFGEKSARVFLRNRVATAAPYKVFFDRLKRGNPGPGNELNGHYDWSKEGGEGVCTFSRDKTDAEDHVLGLPGGQNFGQFQGRQITIFNQATRPEGWQYSFPERPNPNTQGWVHFDIHADNGPDLVNLTHAHEKVHRLIDGMGRLPRAIDEDQDGIPDEWERAIPGMNVERSDSFPGQFTLSDRSRAPRDEEFYAVIGGAYIFGSIRQSGDNNAAALPRGAYRGVVPARAERGNDWSKDGFHWLIEGGTP